MEENKEVNSKISAVMNLRVISFESVMTTSSGEPVKGTEQWHNLLYNCTQISEEEVRSLIQSGMYEYDARVVDLDDRQLKYLRNKEEEDQRPPSSEMASEPTTYNFAVSDQVVVKGEYVGEITFIDEESQRADVMIDDYDGIEYVELSFPLSSLQPLK